MFDIRRDTLLAKKLTRLIEVTERRRSSGFIACKMSALGVMVSNASLHEVDTTRGLLDSPYLQLWHKGVKVRNMQDGEEQI
jgi:hypothetical protein